MAVRLVLDTNILIAGLYRPSADSGRIVTACLKQPGRAVVSRPLIEEYRLIIPRAVRRPEALDLLDHFIQVANDAGDPPILPVVPQDPSDDMLFATALAGEAQAIVTNDRLLLQRCRHGAIHVIPPHVGAAWLDG